MTSEKDSLGISATAGKRSQILAAACCSILFTANAAHAQQEQTAAQTQSKPAANQQTVESLEEVVVTGIRHSLATSIQAKSDATSIVEVISAEDIGKLPDVSIAEALSRVPGLAAQRVDGRSQVIAIRGMASDFATTLLNGREQVSTSDNRGVEYDQYPAELLSGAVVYKTPDAKLVGQGLSGTVDLRTIRPLDYDERKVVLNARGEYNSLGQQNDDADSRGYRLSASYVDQFMDNTLGVALGYAHLDSPFQEQHYKAWWWHTADQDGKPAGATSLEGAEFWARSRDQVRDGLMAVVEWAPSETLHSILDTYYSEFDQKDHMRGIMWTQDPWSAGGIIDYTNAQTTIVRGGKEVLTSGVVDDILPILRNDLNSRKDTLFSLGWNTEWEAGQWTTTADLSYSSADRKMRNIETYAGAFTPGVGFVRDAFAFDIPLNGSGPAQYTTAGSFSDPTRILLGDPGSWGHDGRIETPRQEETLKAGRLQVHYALQSGPFSGAAVGINVHEREKDKTSLVYFANLLNGRTPVAVDSGLLMSPTDIGFSGIPNVLSYDVLGALGQHYTVFLDMSRDDLFKDFTVTEKVRVAYTQLDIDTSLTSTITLRGNVGVQYIHTDQSSDAFQVQGSTVVGSTTRGKTYNDTLPSLNLIADFNNGYKVRFGAAKTLARPRIDDMRASATAGVSPLTGLWSGNGGNPELDPWRAKAYDLSLEKYFGDASYVALAYFYKTLDSYVTTRSVPFDFTGFINTTPEVVPISNIGTFSTPVNGQGGLMRGVEISTALQGSLISPVLDGFGVTLSGSYTDSGTSTSGGMTLPGLSKYVGNAMVYYEKNGFSARISERYRSDFRGEITTNFAQRSFTRILDDRQTDAQLSYEFAEGSSLSGLTVLLQLTNLTNSPYRTVQDGNFAGGAVAPQEYNEYGRTYLLGVNYKL